MCPFGSTLTITRTTSSYGDQATAPAAARYDCEGAHFLADRAARGCGRFVLVRVCVFVFEFPPVQSHTRSGHVVGAGAHFPLSRLRLHQAKFACADGLEQGEPATGCVPLVCGPCLLLFACSITRACTATGSSTSSENASSYCSVMAWT